MPATATPVLARNYRRWTRLGAGLVGAPRPGPAGAAPLPAARRARVPTVLQMEAVECGAAALAMVLAYHGRLVPLEELRVACGVSRDGSKASNMLKAARTHGLLAKGFKKEPAELRSLPFPLILHWNFNHFVVLEGFRRDRVYINDPAQGPCVITAAELDHAFTGVALTFERSAGFQRGGDRRGLIPALLPRLAGSRIGLLFVVLAGLGLVIPGIMAPTFSRIFVDDVLVKGLHSWLRPLLIAMGVTGLLQIVLTWLQQHYLLRLETKLALETSSRFLWHVLSLPISFFTQRYAGEISNRVGINDRVAKLLSGELATSLLGLVLIAFYAMLMFQYDVALTVLSIAVVGLNIAALRWVARTRVDLNQRLLQDRGKLMGIAMGGLQMLETIKATGSESDFFARWSGHLVKATNAGQRLALTTHLLSVLPPLLLAVNTALVLGLGGLRVMDGQLTMGMLIAYQALMLAFISPVNRLVSVGGALQEVRGDLNRLDDVLRARRDPLAELPGEPRAEDAGVLKLNGAVELRNVSFGYSPLEKPLISDFSLQLRPGSRVALVGSSGCGKSTIARLVAGLYDVWDGEILFDGQARAGIPRAVMTNSLAIVDQDIFMFDGSIRDNISLWDRTIPESEVLQAARDACIHDEVAGRYGGYSSHIEEGGRNFSGGQRQRLEIARALASNPSILVLDEATSALDAATEKVIDDNLRRRGCTCLLVAHRLSTIRDCDEIVVLDRGRIVQRGRHEELIQHTGPYSRLIALE